MAKSVKLADTLVAFVRKEADRQSRSLSGQVTHWVNIGRAIEQSAAFDYQHVATVLIGQKSPDDLTSEEQEVWFMQLETSNNVSFGVGFRRVIFSDVTLASILLVQHRIKRSLIA